MRQILSLVLVALLGLGTADACVRKNSQAESNGSISKQQEITILVMDTTQALLPDAELTIDKTTFRTSWDGRIIVKPELLKKEKVFTVSCHGYKSATLSRAEMFAAGSQPVLVKLVALGKSDSHIYHSYGTLTGSTRKKGGADVLYATKETSGEDSRMMYVDRPMVEEAAVSGAMSASPSMTPDVLPAPDSEPVGKGSGGMANIYAGKLTAGEVNDFAKWYLWPSIIDSTHKAYIQDWSLTARHRFTAQVINKNGFPLSAQSVSLLDAKGNTLFQAVTDNTGKAELWYQFIADSADHQAKGLKIRVDNQTVEAKEWSEGLNTIVLDEPCQSAVSSQAADSPSDVDVMFVFDATGSMGDELRYLRAEMQDVIARAKDATGGLSIRTGAVVYRDHGDEYVTRISRLNNDLSVTQSFISDQRASGGGDFPEAVPEALMAAMNASGWNESARARIAFLILDAPCHQDSATLALLHEQLLNAAALGVRVVPVVCSGMDKSGELLMRSIALATNGTSFFLTDDSGIGNTHLKPTTDTLKVEHLNDMLVRTIVEFSNMPSCNIDELTDEEQENDQFIPNPFDAKDILYNPDIPHGEGILYLVDVSGKLISIVNGNIENFQLSAAKIQLPVGIYFIKAFIDGQWYTKKILVNNL